MTRLTPKDVGDLVSRLDTFELGLREITGLGLRGVAIRSVAHDPVCVPLIGARLAVVPITSGEGVISGFADCVATILGHLGCEAWVTAQPDVRGIQAAVAQPYRVEQQSLERTLEPDQYVLVDKLTPRFDDYKRGDIVIFDPPATWAGSRGTPYIKRIIGLAGDKVAVRDGRVYVNDVVLVEPYVYDGQPTVATGTDSEWVVPPGDLFVLGDHREDSADSRVFGPIPREHVIGRAWLRYWPLGTFGVLPTPSYPGVSGKPGAGAASPAAATPEASPSGP